MDLTNDRQRILEDELKLYEQNTEMNEEERKAIHEWVAAGYSVHENVCDAEDGHGHYLDFLDVYRENQYIEEKLSTMNDEEREEYLAELRGEDTINSLRKKFYEVSYKADVYESVLMRHHLMEEAEALIERGKAMSREFDEWAEAERAKMPEGDFEW